MRILLVSHYTLPHAGGIEVLVDQIGRKLAGQGHAVTVVSSHNTIPSKTLCPAHIVRS
jgi:glycosyltransferase involved in cell wall biosynthesis